MKQHIALRDYNYDLGSLFKDYKTLKLTKKGDMIQDETDEILLFFALISLKQYNHMHELKTQRNLTYKNLLHQSSPCRCGKLHASSFGDLARTT